jgi:hypothetical protein
MILRENDGILGHAENLYEGYQGCKGKFHHENLKFEAQFHFDWLIVQ